MRCVHALFPILPISITEEVTQLVAVKGLSSALLAARAALVVHSGLGAGRSGLQILVLFHFLIEDVGVLRREVDIHVDFVLLAAIGRVAVPLKLQLRIGIAGINPVTPIALIAPAGLTICIADLRGVILLHIVQPAFLIPAVALEKLIALGNIQRNGLVIVLSTLLGVHVEKVKLMILNGIPMTQFHVPSRQGDSAEHAHQKQHGQQGCQYFLHGKFSSSSLCRFSGPHRPAWIAGGARLSLLKNGRIPVCPRGQAG